MKCFARRSLGILLALIVTANAAAQGSAFTYQGRLVEDGKPANGIYDFLMTLYDTPTNGSVIGSSLFLNDVAVTNGLFTQVLDFGEYPFSGSPRWLEISVRPGASNTSLTVLAPRQPLTATPYALFAATAGRLLNPVIRNPTFIGTDTLAPLDFSVNSTRALRLQYNLEGPSIIAGSSENFSAPYAVGATIAGGGGIYRDDEEYVTYSNAVFYSFGAIGGGLGNKVRGWSGAIGGGFLNTAGADSAVVAGGAQNEAAGEASAIGGGAGNVARGDESVIPGGTGNIADQPYSSIGGGFGNINQSWFATIAGGEFNNISSNTFRSTIGGGYFNVIDPGEDAPFFDRNGGFSTIAGGSHNRIFLKAVASTIGGGSDNQIQGYADHASISGGAANVVGSNAVFASIGGGQINLIGESAESAVISGGSRNAVGAGSRWSTVNGGYLNSIQTDSEAAAIGGGTFNLIDHEASYATVGGGQFNTIGTNAHHATLSGGSACVIGSNARLATIGGGGENLIGDGVLAATVGGGLENRIASDSDVATIAGGASNSIDEGSDAATLGGGARNRIGAGAVGAVVAGGQFNETFGYSSTIGGGSFNYTDGTFGTVGGGHSNQVFGLYATVPGGAFNQAHGSGSFAAGSHAVAQHLGTFVWGDATEADVTSTTNNEFVARASGGVLFYSSSNLIAGVTLPSGSGSWSSLSDRNAKENLQPVNPREVLRKLAALPLATWNYRAQDATVRHIGPMAQDFHTAFKVGEDERHISSVDADGVALAAIQGLHEQLQEQLKLKDKQIEALEVRNQSLEQRLRKLEDLLDVKAIKSGR